MATRVLVVDDEQDVRDLVKRLLERAGYEVLVAAEGAEGLQRFFDERPDLVILDIRMPRMSGEALLERIREVANTPVIMLTAMGSEQDKVRSLRAGADDYLVKPFGREELLARCEAVLRRAASRPREWDDVYQDNALRMDFARHEVFVKGRRVELSPLEYRLLSALVRNRNRVLTPDTLMDLAWDEGYGTRESLRVYIGYLRQKLGEVPDAPPLIETIRGFGYRYAGPGR